MSKGGIAVLVVAALVFTALGFVFGQVVQAANNTPATLVTESYVQKYVGEMMADMQSKIDELDLRVAELSGSASGDTTVPEPSDNQGPTSTSTNPATPKPTTVKVKSSGVNVRSDASTTASVVGSVTANTVLTYLDQKTDGQGQVWYKVQLQNGTQGWVAGWLCYDPT